MRISQESIDFFVGHIDEVSADRARRNEVRDGSEDDIPLVKENQPTLYDDIRLLFDPPLSLASLPLQDWREEQTRDRGQGRQDEVRHVAPSTDLKGYVDWPSLAQAVRLLVAPPPADA